MRILKLFILILIIFSCKEKTFADDIVLNFPKNEKLTFQEFNEGLDDDGSNFIYYGNASSTIDVKYYQNNIPEAITGFKEKDEKNSLKSADDDYFKLEKIPALYLKYTDDEILTNKNLSIVVRQKDTIPLYKKDFDTRNIKKHKAFPVFIKNISGKTLKIPLEFNDVLLYVKSKENFQLIRNNNFYIDGYNLKKNLIIN